MKTYLAGPMRGIPEWNFPEFFRAQKFLESCGHEVRNPAKNDVEGGLDVSDYPNLPEWFTVEAALTWDFAQIIETKNIVLLEGWESSSGAAKELRVAEDVGAQAWLLIGEQYRAVDYDTIRAMQKAVGGVNFHKTTVAEGVNAMRTFETGATRNVDDTKLDYEGFIHPAVTKCYAEYLNKHRIQADGGVRASDNWQHGIPLDVYAKSGTRHFEDFRLKHRGLDGDPEYTLRETLCAILFNVNGYLFEELVAEGEAERPKEG